MSEGYTYGIFKTEEDNRIAVFGAGNISIRTADNENGFYSVGLNREEEEHEIGLTVEFGDTPLPDIELCFDNTKSIDVLVAALNKIRYHMAKEERL